MIYTSSYFKPDHHIGQPVAISLKQPKGFWEIPKLELFMPSPEMLDAWKNSAQDDAAWADYCAAWWSLMKPRKPKIVEWLESCDPAEDLTLLCYEPSNQYCHRKLVGSIIQKVRPGLWGGEVQQPRPAAPAVIEDVGSLIKWFRHCPDLPQQPFSLNAWSPVSDPTKFYSYLDSSIKRYELHPDDPTEKEHLIRDLTQLKTVVEHLQN